MSWRIALFTVAQLLAVVSAQFASGAELRTPEFRLSLPGTWTERPDYAAGVVSWDRGDRNYAFLETQSGSLLHVRIFPSVAEWDPKKQNSFLEQMEQEESFWGEPAHPTFARLLANVFYAPPKAYHEANSPYIFGKKHKRKRKFRTLFIWEIERAKGNAHLFYMSQLTPRIAAENIGGLLHMGEEYVALKLTRVERVASPQEALVMEVQTKNPVADVAVDVATMPESIRGKRLRYCLVMRWKGTRADDPHLMALLSTPVRSGVDCNDVQRALLWK